MSCSVPVKVSFFHHHPQLTIRRSFNYKTQSNFHSPASIHIFLSPRALKGLNELQVRSNAERDMWPQVPIETHGLWLVNPPPLTHPLSEMRVE